MSNHLLVGNQSNGSEDADERRRFRQELNAIVLRSNRKGEYEKKAMRAATRKLIVAARKVRDDLGKGIS